MTSYRGSPAGVENRAKKDRARQRARRATASQFREEFHRLRAEKSRGLRRGLTNAEEQQCMRAICAAHPDEYRAHWLREQALEGVVRLPMGSIERIPHGTVGAVRRHRRRDEPLCGVCAAYWQAKYLATCRVCACDFSNPGRTDFCSPPCRRLWNGYLRYYADFTGHQVSRARHVLKYRQRFKDSEIAHAARVLAEFERTGRVERKRGKYKAHPEAARELAEQQGVDLAEAIERAEKWGAAELSRAGPSALA